jgi:hypothetical protein
MLLNFLAYSEAPMSTAQNVTCHILTRKELAKRTGYSQRHISRIWREIPGASLKPSGRVSYDENHPDFDEWVRRARAANDKKQARREIGVVRKRKNAAPSMREDLQAIQECVAAFNSWSLFLHKIHVHSTGVDIDPTLSYEEWCQFLKLMKHSWGLPPIDRIELLFDYFAGSQLPAALKDLLKVTQWLGRLSPST